MSHNTPRIVPKLPKHFQTFPTMFQHNPKTFQHMSKNCPNIKKYKRVLRPPRSRRDVETEARHLLRALANARGRFLPECPAHALHDQRALRNVNYRQLFSLIHFFVLVRPLFHVPASSSAKSLASVSWQKPGSPYQWRTGFQQQRLSKRRICAKD